MKSSAQRDHTPDGVEIFIHHWQPDGATRATLQIVHGMGEHSARYARVAERFCAAGFEVFRQKPIDPVDLAHEVARLARHTTR